MAAIVFGMLCASMFALATVASSRSVKVVSPYVVVGWVMAVGLVICAPLTTWGGVPTDLDLRTITFLALVGLGNVGGLVLVYAALRIGRVSIVAPIVAAEGAIAAILSVFVGEPLGALSAVALVVIAGGVILATLGTPDADPTKSLSIRSVVLALAAMASFGVSLFLTGFLSGDVPTGLLLLPPRVVGVLVITIPLAVSGKMSIPKRIVPLVVIAGAAEVLGFVFYIGSAQSSIAVASVLMSQYALIAALIGLLLFRERLTRMQGVGVVVLLIGVTILGMSA